MTTPISERSSNYGSTEENCSICLDMLGNDPALLVNTCSSNEKIVHTFHKTCLATWMSRSSTCPLCRGPLRLRDLANLSVNPIPNNNRINQVLLGFGIICLLAVISVFCLAVAGLLSTSLTMGLSLSFLMLASVIMIKVREPSSST